MSRFANYTNCSYLFGAGAAGYVGVNIYHKLDFGRKIEPPIQKLSFTDYHARYFSKDVYRKTRRTCADKIVANICCGLSYPLHLGVSSKPIVIGAAYGGAVGGCVLGSLIVGSLVGVTWPVSVPLFTIYVLETEYGYKFC